LWTVANRPDSPISVGYLLVGTSIHDAAVDS
jgi:hypothetical protein